MKGTSLAWQGDQMFEKNGPIFVKVAKTIAKRKMPKY
jgi:hypothetical protein